MVKERWQRPTIVPALGIQMYYHILYALQSLGIFPYDNFYGMARAPEQALHARRHKGGGYARHLRCARAAAIRRAAGAPI